MQRAKAIVEQAKAEGSNQVLPVEAGSSKASKGHLDDALPDVTPEEQDTNEEHWILPSQSTSARLKRKASITSHVSHESGWNAWLLEADDGEQIEEPENTSAIRVYGTWRKKQKRKRGDEDADSSQKTSKSKSESADPSIASAEDLGFNASDTDVSPQPNPFDLSEY